MHLTNNSSTFTTAHSRRRIAYTPHGEGLLQRPVELSSVSLPLCLLIPPPQSTIWCHGSCTATGNGTPLLSFPSDRNTRVKKGSRRAGPRNDQRAPSSSFVLPYAACRPFGSIRVAWERAKQPCSIANGCEQELCVADAKKNRLERAALALSWKTYIQCIGSVMLGP